MQAEAQGGGIEVAFSIWRRRKWLMLGLFAWGCTAATSVALFLPNVYESTATILVERQQVPEAFVQATVTGGLDLRLQTITQEVLSRARLEGLMHRFELYEDIRGRVSLEEVIETMRRDITVEHKSKPQSRGKEEATVAFSISYKGKHPQQVAHVANTIASFFIDENLKVRERQAAGTAEFLGAQLTEVKQKLEEQEKRLSQFKERYMGELPEQLTSNLAVLEGLNTQLRLGSEKLARSNVQRATLLQQLSELEGLRSATRPRPELVPEGQPDPQVVRLDTLRRQLATLRARYNETYPDIALLQAQIAALEQQPSTPSGPKSSHQETEPPLHPYTQQLKKELGTLDAELQALRLQEQHLLSSVQLYKQRVENTPRRDQELQLILRDYDTAKSQYQSLLKRDEEARLAESLEQRQKGEQFRLLEPALPGKKPVQPKRSKVILMGCVAALGLAGGSAVLLEFLRPSFHTARELAAFAQVPVLVSLPRIVTTAEQRRKRWRFVLAVPCFLALVVLTIGASFVAITKPAQLVAFYGQLRGLSK